MFFGTALVIRNNGTLCLFQTQISASAPHSIAEMVAMCYVLTLQNNLAICFFVFFVFFLLWGHLESIEGKL